jgi:hypothetical protein
MNKLFGQFASLPVAVSILLVLPALGPPNDLAWPMEFFLITTTMLVVGLFAVLSWDLTFPNRHDGLVLAPPPVRGRTLFLAKMAAVAGALSLTVVTLHCVAGCGVGCGHPACEGRRFTSGAGRRPGPSAAQRVAEARVARRVDLGVSARSASVFSYGCRAAGFAV